jgi:prevent-host-death family protein
MQHVKSSDFRKELSSYLWRVSQNKESFVITDYGRPVAVLGPVPEDQQDANEASNG